MGLFNFIKNAGAKIFGRKDKKADATGQAPVYTQEQLDSMKADELIGLVKGLGLKIDTLYVAVEDDIATVAGETATLSEKEKVILAIGNVTGIAQVDDQIKVVGVESEEAVIEQAESVFHTVVSGDSLSKISKKYYGDYMKYMIIFEANKPMLKDVDLIYPGQVLRIPSLA